MVIHVIDAVQQTQAVFAVLCLGCHTQPFKVVQQVVFDAFQPGFCRPDIVGLDAKGDEFGFAQAVVSLGELIAQHVGVFVSDIIKSIILGRDINGLLKAIHAGNDIEKRKLKMDGAVKIVEKVTPAVKDGCFVLVLSQLVVDVLKLDALGEKPVGHSANTVRIHPLRSEERRVGK